MRAKKITATLRVRRTWLCLAAYKQAGGGKVTNLHQNNTKGEINPIRKRNRKGLGVEHRKQPEIDR